MESKQGVIVISSTGITIAGGSDLTDDIYTSADAETFASALSPSGDWNSYKVKVRVVGSKVTEMCIRDSLYAVQVGAFANRDNAERLAAQLKEKGYAAYITRK